MLSPVINGIIPSTNRYLQIDKSGLKNPEETKNLLIRNAKKADYHAVRRIMNQVQEMHVAWRPDIYKSNENLINMELL